MARGTLKRDTMILQPVGKIGPALLQKIVLFSLWPKMILAQKNWGNLGDKRALSFTFGFRFPCSQMYILPLFKSKTQKNEDVMYYVI